MGLPYCENFIILTSTVFLWYTRLSDGRAIAYTRCRYAVARKNHSWSQWKAVWYGGHARGHFWDCPENSGTSNCDLAVQSHWRPLTTLITIEWVGTDLNVEPAGVLVDLTNGVLETEVGHVVLTTVHTLSQSLIIVTRWPTGTRRHEVKASCSSLLRPESIKSNVSLIKQLSDRNYCTRTCIDKIQDDEKWISVVAYGPKMVKPLHAGPKHQIWYMYSLGQYKHFWMGYPHPKMFVLT